jgi:hypothetical protein
VSFSARRRGTSVTPAAINLIILSFPLGTNKIARMPKSGKNVIQLRTLFILKTSPN